MIRLPLGALGAALFVAGWSAPSDRTDAVSYSAAPVFRDGQLAALTVMIGLTGDEDGETEIRLPGSWAGSDSLWRHISELTVTGAAVKVEEPHRRVLRHAPGAKLSVRYTVHSAYDSAPGFSYEKARPLILHDWFVFHGEGVFAVPDGRLDDRAEFAWSGFPAGWQIASDLDHLTQGGTGTVADIVESVALGGTNVVVRPRDIGGASLRVAIGGDWRFDPDSFAESISRIVVAANRMWGDEPRPFLVTVAPLGGGDRGISTHGTGRGDAFSVASTSGFQLAPATRFLAHEYLHTWFPHAFGRHLSPDEPRGYWFSEGFTDFFAARILVTAGLWSFADYLTDLNGTLARHAASPARDATGAEIAQRFWTDYQIQRIPYDRGHLFAHVLDHRLRSASNGGTGLRDVLSAQRVRAERSSDAAVRLFVQEMQSMQIDIAADVDALMERGAPLFLPEDLFGACASIETVTQPQSDRGAGPDANRAVTLQRVVPAEGADPIRCLAVD
jgi:predicted metalloprotease with PDZ domain